MDLQKICDDVESEWKMGGLSNGLYGDYAKEVARRAVEAEREACAKVCYDLWRVEADAAAKGTDAPKYHDAIECADAIRARSNAKLCGAEPQAERPNER